MDLEIRHATEADLASLERRCWRSGEDEMRERIRRDDTCSIVGLDARADFV